MKSKPFGVLLRRSKSAAGTTAIFALCFGCACKHQDLGVRIRPGNSLFRIEEVARVTEREVLSRQWLDADGVRQTLLSYEVQRIEGRPAVAVATFGDRPSNRTNSFEIFKFYEAVGSIDQPNMLLLICHDNRAGRLTKLHNTRQGERVLFDVTRRLPRNGTGPARVNWYSYELLPDGTIVHGFSDFWGGTDE